MTKESATFVVQRGSSAYGCEGDKLAATVKDNDLFAVQQNAPTVEQWKYKETQTAVTSRWETLGKNILNNDLGLTPNAISKLAFEVDMLMGDNNTLYYFYYQYLLKSTDGFTWEVVNSDLPFHKWAYDQNLSNAEGYATQCSYIDGNIFVNYVNHIWKSADNGVTWKEVADYQSHFNDKFDVRVKKAFHKASSTTMLFFATSKSDSSSYMVYSLDAGETWKLHMSYFEKGRWFVWLDDKQHFLVLVNNQLLNGGDKIYSIPWDAVINNDKRDYQEILNVPCSDYYTHKLFIATPDYIFIKGVSSGASYLLDHDCNILRENASASCSWNVPIHCTHATYDPASDDVLFGEHIRAANSTPTPMSGRFRLGEIDNGMYCPSKSDDSNSQITVGGSMVYHPPTKRYYQATENGIFYSFEQLPNDEDFIEKTTVEIDTNLDEIEDSALLCCTDTDDIAYSVTGAQFKELMTK